jgi:hypothetical protein
MKCITCKRVVNCVSENILHERFWYVMQRITCKLVMHKIPCKTRISLKCTTFVPDRIKIGQLFNS